MNAKRSVACSGDRHSIVTALVVILGPVGGDTGEDRVGGRGGRDAGSYADQKIQAERVTSSRIIHSANRSATC